MLPDFTQEQVQRKGLAPTTLFSRMRIPGSSCYGQEENRFGEEKLLNKVKEGLQPEFYPHLGLVGIFQNYPLF